MGNTKITYTYTPAVGMSPFPKEYAAAPTIKTEVIINGRLTEDQIDRILSYLEYGESFIPRQVGLPETRLRNQAPDSQSDHAWFILRRNGFEETDEFPTIRMSAEELLSNFNKADDDGWDPFLWENSNKQGE